MKTILACAALGLALITQNAAVAAPVDAHQIVASFTLENLATAAAGVGYKFEALADSNGTKALGVTAPDGLKFIAQPSACQKPGQQSCAGLTIFALWSGATPSDLLDRFNLHHTFTSVFNATSNTILQRYEIADFGIPIGNVASNFANFDKMAQLLVTFVKSGGASASLVPGSNVKPALQSFGGAPVTPVGDDPLFNPTAGQQSYFNALPH